MATALAMARLSRRRAVLGEQWPGLQSSSLCVVLAAEGGEVGIEGQHNSQARCVRAPTEGAKHRAGEVGAWAKERRGGPASICQRLLATQKAAGDAPRPPQR